MNRKNSFILTGCALLAFAAMASGFNLLGVANIFVGPQSNGYHIGTKASDLLSFYDGTPTSQRHGTSGSQTALTDSTSGSTSNQTLAAGALTDNSGGGTADGTIGVVTAPSALTDSTGGSASTTLAAVTAFTPSVAWNGSSVYPSAADATAIAAAQTSLKNSAASLAARQAEDRTALVALTDAVKELSTKSNVHNDNNAKITKLLNELRASLVEKKLIKGAN